MVAERVRMREDWIHQSIARQSENHGENAIGPILEPDSQSLVRTCRDGLVFLRHLFGKVILNKTKVASREWLSWLKN